MKNYSPIINYFIENQFGNELPVLSMLSALPPVDNINIIYEVLKNDTANEVAYWKLAMSYLRNDQKNIAFNLLDEAFDKGYISSQTLSEYKQDIINEEMNYSDNYGSSETISQALQLIYNSLDGDTLKEYVEFLNLIYDLAYPEYIDNFDSYPAMREIELDDFTFRPTNYKLWTNGEVINAGFTSSVVVVKQVMSPFLESQVIKIEIVYDELTNIIQDNFSFSKAYANIDRLILSDNYTPKADYNVPNACSIFTSSGKIVKVSFTFSDFNKSLELNAFVEKPK